MKRVSLKRILSLGLFMTTFFAACHGEDATDEFIRKCVEEEIARQVEVRVQRANQRIANLKENIKLIVSDEVTRQVDDFRKEQESEGAERRELQIVHEPMVPAINQQIIASTPEPSRVQAVVCQAREKSSGRDRGDLYMHPFWPAYSQYYSGNDLFQLSFAFDTATQSYSSQGKTQDIVSLSSRQQVKLQDILLVSKLVANGKLKSSAGFVTPDLLKNNHYLGFMANLPIVFDGNQEFYRFDANFSRHYFNGDLSVGVHFPFAIRHLKVKIKGQLPADVQSKIANVAQGFKADGNKLYLNGKKDAEVTASESDAQDQTETIRTTQLFQFYQLYGSFNAFVESLLQAKGIDLYRNTTSLELGDIELYTHLNLHSRYYKEGLVGLKLTLPSAQRTDGFALFDPAVGNNGTTQFSAFLSFLWAHRWWCNPHLHMTGTYSFPAHLRMRVPRLVEQGRNTMPAREILWGKDLQYTDQTFMELDATVKGFADTTSRVRVTAGPELFIRLGNVIEHAGFKRAFLDLYYDFFVKGKSSHSRSVIETSVATGERVICTGFSLNDNTWEVYHRLGLDWSYQFDARYRARAGFFYTIAGANTPKNIGFALQFSSAF